MVTNAFFSPVLEIGLHIQVFDKMFYRAEPMGAAQNTVSQGNLLDYSLSS